MYNITFFVQATNGLQKQVWDTYPNKEAAEADLKDAAMFLEGTAFKNRVIVRKHKA